MIKTEIYQNNNADHAPQKVTEDDVTVASAPWSILDMPLFDIVNDPSFKITSISSTTDKDKNESVLLSFTLDSKSEKYEMMKKLKTGNCRLSPQNNYAVLDFEATFPDATNNNFTFRNKGKCEYSKESGPFPLLKYNEYSLLRNAGTIREITWKTEVKNLELHSLKNRDFTLSHYGLPEPVNPNRNIIILRIAIILAGIILIGAGLYVKKMKKGKVIKE